MKPRNSSPLRSIRIPAIARAAACLLPLLSTLAIGRAEVLVDTDFAKGDFQSLGWKADGAWDITTYPSEKNNPGPVARFPARKPEGALTKTFAELHNPKSLNLSLDVGFGWGAADHAEGAHFMLLDAQGNGYVFATQRANAKWAVEWAPVTGGKPPKDRTWAPENIDATQTAIRDGGGMEHLTLTRDVGGNWTFTSQNWNKGAGATLKFSDTTTTRFTKLVLVGTQNSDEPAFNKIVLDATQGSDYPQNRISVTAPAYGADVKGDTTIAFAAPGFTKTTVKCWKQGPAFGSDSTIGEVKLDDAGRGTIVFPADQYPHGPITVRLSGENGKLTDNCYLQLYNKGGVSWNEGLPKDPPPAAQGMKLVFADDFSKPLSISSNDPKAIYYDHKPPDGSQDFSTLPFTSFDRPNNPFAQVDTYLRIRASEKAHSAGLISSLKKDGTGITATVPCYFECRFTGPNAIGAWPAFWLLTIPTPGDKGGDELDIIEAYGGEGPHEPNSKDSYMITPHAWNQGSTGKELEKHAFEEMHNPCKMNKFGIPSTWYEAPHTYACKVTETETIYYCDNIEVGRHKSLPVSTQRPLYFLINLATGGGWPVNLSPYDGQVDMYVDYVRVYQGEKK
jgi:Glycosyl hydrolases family 16